MTALVVTPTQNTMHRLAVGLRPFLCDGRRIGIKVDWYERSATASAPWVSHGWGGWSLSRPARDADHPTRGRVAYDGPFPLSIDIVLHRPDGQIVPRRLKLELPTAQSLLEIEHLIDTAPNAAVEAVLRAELKQRRDLRVAVFPSPNAPAVPGSTVVYGTGAPWGRIIARLNGTIAGLGQCDVNGEYSLTLHRTAGRPLDSALTFAVEVGLPPGDQIPAGRGIPPEVIALGAPASPPTSPDPAPLLSAEVMPTSFTRRSTTDVVALVGRRTRSFVDLTIPAN